MKIFSVVNFSFFIVSSLQSGKIFISETDLNKIDEYQSYIDYIGSEVTRFIKIPTDKWNSKEKYDKRGIYFLDQINEFQEKLKTIHQIFTERGFEKGKCDIIRLGKKISKLKKKLMDSFSDDYM